MELRFWGVRGTCAAPGRPASKYGGNTPCAAVTPRRGHLLVLDAGTGIRILGNALRDGTGGPAVRCSIFLSHFHLDHVSGLPFFAPLFSAAAELTFYSVLDPAETRRRLGRLMGAPFFPILFDRTPARKTFRRIGRDGVTVGGLRVTACPLRHPQGSSAFRISERRSSVVYATDGEPGEAGEFDPRLVRFAAGADALIYDTMFTPEEYADGRKGWGHGTWQDAVRTATAAGVGTLLLYHFHPEHSDRTIALMERKARKAFPDASCAYEGLRLRF
jgi:ribonuclease BN (tRNA processing enzyme)